MPVVFSPGWVTETKGELEASTLWRLDTFLPSGFSFPGLLLLLSALEDPPGAYQEVTRVACCQRPGSPERREKGCAAQLLKQPRK